MVNQIEYNVANAADYVQSARQETNQAVKYQSKARKVFPPRTEQTLDVLETVKSFPWVRITLPLSRFAEVFSDWNLSIYQGADRQESVFKL